MFDIQGIFIPKVLHKIERRFFCLIFRFKKKQIAMRRSFPLLDVFS
jgi:hypothetical protein